MESDGERGGVDDQRVSLHLFPEQDGTLLIDVRNDNIINIELPVRDERGLDLQGDRLQGVIENIEFIVSAVNESQKKTLRIVDRQSLIDEVLNGRLSLHTYKAKNRIGDGLSWAFQDVAYVKISNTLIDDVSDLINVSGSSLYYTYFKDIFRDYLEGLTIYGVGSWFVEPSARSRGFAFEVPSSVEYKERLSRIMARNIRCYAESKLNDDTKRAYLMSLRLYESNSYKHPLRRTLLEEFKDAVEVTYLPSSNGREMVRVVNINDDPAWEYGGDDLLLGNSAAEEDSFASMWLGLTLVERNIVGALVFVLAVSVEKAGQGANQKYSIYRDWVVNIGMDDTPVNDISFIVSKELVTIAIIGVTTMNSTTYRHVPREELLKGVLELLDN